MSEQEVYKWFIAHVAYRNENNVKSLLDIAGLEYYMPFKTVSRTWKGVKKEFQVPVPSCAFVRVTQSDFIMLRMMKELSLMLDGEGNPLALSDEQMNAIQEKMDTSDNLAALVLEFINDLIKK